MASSNSPDQDEALLSSAIKVASNDDLLTKILLALPTKPLLRSKSVSKHWLALIIHPSFVVLRRKCLGPTPVGLFLQPCRPFRFSHYRLLPLDGSPLPPAPPFRSLSFHNDEATIIQSCKGLLLCLERSEAPGLKYYVFNPTSGRFDVLTNDRFLIQDMCLVFDPSESKNYKVVSVRAPEETGEWRIDLYSSETGVWHETGICEADHPYLEFDGGVYCSGAVHWIVQKGNSSYFNICDQQLKELVLPSVLTRCSDREIAYFGESNNHLHLVASQWPFTSSEFDVYELEKDYSTWFVKFRVDLSAVGVRFMGNSWSLRLPYVSYYNYFLLQIVHGEREEKSYLVYNDKGIIMRYDFSSGTSEVIHSCRPDQSICAMFGDSLKFYDYIYAFPFYECLSCVI